MKLFNILLLNSLLKGGYSYFILLLFAEKLLLPRDFVEARDAFIFHVRRVVIKMFIDDNRCYRFVHP